MNNQKVLDVVRKIFNYTISRNRFDKTLNKVNIISAGNGQCLAEMFVEKEHINGHGTLHGGLIATAIDVITGAAVATHPRAAAVGIFESMPDVGVSVDIHISYLAPAKIGDTVLFDAETVKRGKNLAYLKCSLFRKSDNVVIAYGTHTKFVG